MAPFALNFRTVSSEAREQNNFLNIQTRESFLASSERVAGNKKNTGVESIRRTAERLMMHGGSEAIVQTIGVVTHDALPLA